MKRRYDQYCAVACGLDVIGERWAMLVVRELLSGPKRFADLEAGLPGIGTNTLATRLDEMGQAGVIARRALPPPAAAMAYELTPWGWELEPIVHALARWGARRLAAATPVHPVRATWLAIALQAFFRRDAVADLAATVEVVLPTGTLALRFDRGALTVATGVAERPALRLVASEEQFLGLLSAGEDADPGALEVEGDPRLVDRLVEAFPLR